MSALKEVRDVYNDYAPSIQARKTEALMLENRLSDLVNQAYGLTPEEVDLMWKTAPPIDLIDGEQLVQRLKELGLGAKITMIESVEVDSE